MVRERIETLLKQLTIGIFENDEVMALALLSSIAGESIFLLGPPGVAKSLIARRLKYAYKGAKVFEYLMSRFSTPDEIFGPVKISMLKKDKYERAIENYLPSAEVVFLDEIWKAGPSIQNALLTVINEKIFRNGGEEINIPMKALISASNELPAKEQGLEALWDRFIVRLYVDGIENDDNFINLLSMPQNHSELKIDKSISDYEYREWSNQIDQIKIPEFVNEVILDIRSYICLHNNRNKEKKENIIYVSDRRWKKIVRLLRTSAFLNDRAEVDLMDCFLIKHCIWDNENQKETSFGFVRDAISNNGPDFDMNLFAEKDQYRILKTEIENNTKKESGVKKVSFQYNNQSYYQTKYYYDNKYYLIDCVSVDQVNNSSLNSKIYTADYKNYLDIQIKKSQNINEIIIYDRNYGWKAFPLYTEPVIIPYSASPSRGDFELWNKETNDMISVLENNKEEIINFWDMFSDSFYNNIFVDKTYADSHIKTKIDTTKKEIEKLMLDINELKSKYTSIYKP